MVIPDFLLEKSALSDSEGLQDQTRREFGLLCRVFQILRSKNPGLPRKIGKSDEDLPNDPFRANFAIAKFGIKKFLVSLINFYRNFLSGYKLQCCRFYPSCSEYAAEAIEKKGIFRGVLISSFRILKCNPFSRGGYDPVK